MTAYWSFVSGLILGTALGWVFAAGSQTTRRLRRRRSMTGGGCRVPRGQIVMPRAHRGRDAVHVLALLLLFASGCAPGGEVAVSDGLAERRQTWTPSRRRAEVFWRDRVKRTRLADGSR